HVQICAQALCLEEMTGRSVPWGLVWLAAWRRRLRVSISENLRGQTLAAIAEVRTWLASERLPPAVNDARWRQCKLLDLCQPGLTARPASVRRYMREVAGCIS